jgi:RNA-binding protein YhbY
LWTFSALTQAKVPHLYTLGMKIHLSPAERQKLKGEAHALSPLIIIGDNGLTAAVIREIDRTLKAHELIKIRANTDERDVRAAWLDEICNALSVKTQKRRKNAAARRSHPPYARKNASQSIKKRCALPDKCVVDALGAAQRAPNPEGKLHYRRVFSSILA